MGKPLNLWLERVRTRIGDAGPIQIADDKNALTGIEAALAQLGSDFPLHATEPLTGDDATFDFALPLWVDRESIIVEVEYPAGSRTPDLITTGYIVRRDGTFRTVDFTAATGETIDVTYTTPSWPMPTNEPEPNIADLVPDGMFSGVVALAASIAIHDEAVQMGRRKSSTVQAARFENDPTPLFDAARGLRRIYDAQINRIPPSAGSGAMGPSSGDPEVQVTAQNASGFGHTVFGRG